MKKTSIIVLILGSAMLLGNQGKAQHFYTSLGVGVSWNIPAFVNYSVHDHYLGYDIAHVNRFKRHGHSNYNVLLHRNGRFVEVRMDNHGHIYRTIDHGWSYPLMSHNCGGHCGFHQTYYRTYYPQYHHHAKIVYVDAHHGHGNKHHQNSYYTNVYVEKQHKPQQQTRSNTSIRKPAQSSVDVVGRSQEINRGTSMDSQRISANSRGSNARSSSGNVITYKNQRGQSR